MSETADRVLGVHGFVRLFLESRKKPFASLKSKLL